MSTLGERLKEERLRIGLNQTEFGKNGDVTKETQSNYERDVRKPNPNYFEKIMTTGVDVKYIMFGKRDINSEDPNSKEGLINSLESELQKIKKGFEGIENLLKSLKEEK
ncbi:helix-turn-helix transcriptional regulator [Candidatus Albibeggiatoa sp. nov. BB20]|uniref:helix-turn-helix domain-containing protein n=1 Tax=Candidatus Albibeggiatoa sp. nov. BB20 TaxID=3162723 RepID=UPI0033659B3B